MLHLFLTGRRAAYMNDIFTVLHMPENTVYDLKYRIYESGDKIIHSSAEKENCKIEDEVLVLYSDMKGRYIPLRFGKLEKVESEEGQLYYGVRLKEYCHWKCNESGEFLDKLAPEIYIRKESENGKVGVLAVYFEYDPEKYLEKAEDSWSKTVRMLGKQSQFKDYYSIFTKLQIEDLKRKKRAGTWENKLKSGRKYKVHISYYIPDYNSSRMELIPVKFQSLTEELIFPNIQENLVSEQNRIEFLCDVDSKKPKDAVFRMRILKNEVSSKEVQYARTELHLPIEPVLGKVKKRLLTGLCLILLFVSNIINAIPYAAILKNKDEAMQCLYKLSEILQKTYGMYTVVCGVISTAATAGLIILIGKAKL